MLLGEVFLKRAAQHLLHDFAGGGLGCDGRGIHDFAVAHHGVAFADLDDLVDAVGNKDNGDILRFLKVLDQPEKLGGFRIAQRCGRLVKNQEIAFVGYGSGDEDHLLLRKGEVLHQRAHVYINVQPVQHGLGLRAQLGPVDEGIAAGVHDHVVEHDVFGNRKRGDQRHVHLLVDDLNAQLLGGHGGAQLDGLAVEVHLACIIRICTRKDLHQGGLARSVGAYERVNLTGADLKVYIG